MKNNIIISILSFVGTILFAVPNLVIIAAILLTFISKYISLLFLLLFTWNIGKLVQHFHKKSQERNEQ